MTEQVIISKPRILKEFKENGLGKKEVREKLYPNIPMKDWLELWDTPVEEGGLGLKGQRPKKKVKFKIVDEDVEPEVQEEQNQDQEQSENEPAAEEDYMQTTSEPQSPGNFENR